MQVKVTKKVWYNNTLYDPELETADIIIDYPCKDAKKLPSWAEVVTAKAAVQKENKGEGENKGNDAEDVKVGELPVAEKNKLIEEAATAGITGNQILSWKVTTLKAKIEAAQKDKEKEGGEGENKGEGNEE